MLQKSSEIYALVDCNNFFVSCERVFDLSLAYKPVVVLSNNDGVVISRSAEVKRLGVPMGAPYFKVRTMLSQVNAPVFSSNFELYSDMSRRFMQTLRCFTNKVEPYSIDEAFLTLKDSFMSDSTSLGALIKELVQQWISIPVSVGIASTKTLAKAANELAKKDPSSGGVLNFANLDENSLNDKLSNLDISDVWGVGYKHASFLKSLGITNALLLKNLDSGFVKKSMTVTGLKTQMELQGFSCVALKSPNSLQKSILSSRSFSTPLKEKADLLGAISTFISLACEKLRSQNAVALTLGLYIRTSYYASKNSQYSMSSTIKLPDYSNDTATFIKMGHLLLNKVYKTGFLYSKAGIYLIDIESVDVVKVPNLFSSLFQKSPLIGNTIDLVNSRYGKNGIKYGASFLGNTWGYKEDYISKKYTTSWSELPEVT